MSRCGAQHIMRARQGGASMLEYAIMAAILVPVFVAAGYLLKEVAAHRARTSTKAVEHVVPCVPSAGGLAADEKQCL